MNCGKCNTCIHLVNKPRKWWRASELYCKLGVWDYDNLCVDAMIMEDPFDFCTKHESMSVMELRAENKLLRDGLEMMASGGCKGREKCVILLLIGGETPVQCSKASCNYWEAKQLLNSHLPTAGRTNE